MCMSGTGQAGPEGPQLRAGHSRVLCCCGLIRSTSDFLSCHHWPLHSEDGVPEGHLPRFLASKRHSWAVTSDGDLCSVHSGSPQPAPRSLTPRTAPHPRLPRPRTPSHPALPHTLHTPDTPHSSHISCCAEPCWGSPQAPGLRGLRGEALLPSRAVGNPLFTLKRQPPETVSLHDF